MSQIFLLFFPPYFVHYKAFFSSIPLVIFLDITKYIVELLGPNMLVLSPLLTQSLEYLISVYFSIFDIFHLVVIKHFNCGCTF